MVTIKAMELKNVKISSRTSVLFPDKWSTEYLAQPADQHVGYEIHRAYATHCLT